MSVKTIWFYVFNVCGPFVDSSTRNSTQRYWNVYFLWKKVKKGRLLEAFEAPAVSSFSKVLQGCAFAGPWTSVRQKTTPTKMPAEEKVT